MNVIRLAYNCPPDTLGDVEQADFVDAFENEIAAVPLLRSADVLVTFDAGHSGRAYSISFADTYTLSDYDRVVGLIETAGRRAWMHCLGEVTQ